jgi:predicted O-methyltransferase YrrM
VSYEEIYQLVDTIHGWRSPKEGKLLYNLAKQCTGRGVIVEIGSWKGKSTIWLAKGSKAGNNVKIYAIDPHSGSPEHKEWYGNIRTFEEFKSNIKTAEVDDIVIPIVKSSFEVASNFHEPVELIFIDGAHEFEAVNQDFELWFPKVVDHGLIAFHDSVGNIWIGPEKVVENSLYKSRSFKKVGFKGTISYGEKATKATYCDYLQNRLRLFFKQILEFFIYRILFRGKMSRL